MNYVVYYLNSAGYPSFCFVCAEGVKDCKRQFKSFHPNDEIEKIFIAVDDMRNWLIASL